ncbi:MAG: phosphate ABC transporter substrate-binding protein [Candidatus Eisenbacteria bacterium]|uniref:Phosphate-binding protein n=1 Tax=Eiseniibacteriota bacterium TaxID=2212470 RepID=A0A948S095_UNCEI|nr:phosphate ABC transporter substrate-binding protein [Candidatus Eisenbacteria bacterium]MBU1951074.1 phosphate ABC transporter substrate-binding protein [Candidatus Eisenbacteria bacterium]MBU2693211.1 phosphate ABC transporter substrate-binding protein [Candidatus Eisenbacteria bacterium]
MLLAQSRLTLTGLLILGLALAGLTGVHAEETRIIVDGSTTVGPIAKAFAEYYMGLHPDVQITVSESGSGNGAKSLINGTCEIADMSRFMKENEFAAAVEKGIMPVAHVVAMDGLPIIVHPSNPVSGLTVEQVRDIYVGKITNWNQVGGPDKKIVVVSRDTNSGTYETFENLVMNKEKMAESVEYVGSNGAARQRVQSTPSAIGYAGLGFVDQTVKALDINGITPNQSTVSSGVYPIARPLYMFTNGYPKLGSHIHAFVTLHLTKDGQEIIEAIGFIPVTAY